MKPSALLAGFLLFSLAIPLAGRAETRYVSDQLILVLRSQKGENFQALKSLKTDTPVEILEEDDVYARVRLKGGEEGYVLKHYLTADLPKTLVIGRLEKEVARLKAQMAELEEKRGVLALELEQARKGRQETGAELEEQAAALGLRLAAAEKELKGVSERYEELKSQSGNVLQLAAERDRLEKDASLMAAELGQLRQENESLLRTAMIQWFLAGAGVFFIGWIVGKLSIRKKRGSF